MAQEEVLSLKHKVMEDDQLIAAFARVDDAREFRDHLAPFSRVEEGEELRHD